MKILIFLFASCLFLIGNSFAGAATQTTIDKKIFEGFDAITARSADLAEQVEDLNFTRVDLENQIVETQRDLSEIAEDDQSPEAIQARKTLQSKIINLLARQLKLSFEIVSKSENVVSANLKTINELTERYSNSPRSKAITKTLRRKIKRGINAGKSIHQSLTQMVKWAKSDPMMKNKFKDLKRIMHLMDAKTSIEMKLFPNDRVPDGTDVDSKMLALFEKQTKNLMNDLAEIKIKEAKLNNTKRNLEITLQVTKFARAEQTINNAIPDLQVINPSSPGIGGLGSKLDPVLDDLHKDIMRDLNGKEDQPTNFTPGDIDPEKLDPGTTKNFN